MSVRRFYVPEIVEAAGVFELDDDQTRHLRSVLRLKVSDTVRAFNGKGCEYECRILQLTRKSAQIEVISEVGAQNPESDLKITLGIPLIKPANAELILQKAVELGVCEVIPFHSARCDSVRKLNRERWEKIIVESSKQCGRAVLMKLGDVVGFEEFVEDSKGCGILFSEFGEGILPESVDGNQITAVTGPEGGWEASEVEFAKESGFSIVHFGGRILRAETAAIVVTGLLQHRFGDMK